MAPELVMYGEYGLSLICYCYSSQTSCRLHGVSDYMSLNWLLLLGHTSLITSLPRQIQPFSLPHSSWLEVLWDCLVTKSLISKNKLLLPIIPLLEYPKSIPISSRNVLYRTAFESATNLFFINPKQSFDQIVCSIP